MERYTDDKHAEVVYHIVDAAEYHQQPKPKRPVWRKVVRVLLTVAAVSMIFFTLKPVFQAFRHKCHGGRKSDPMFTIPEKNMNPPIDLDMDHHFLDEVETPYQHYDFPSNLKTFYIRQESFTGLSRVQIVGNLIVHSCDKAENISAHFKFELSDEDLRPRLAVEPHDDGIVFKLDPFTLVRETVNATIFLILPVGKVHDKDYSLEELTVSTIQLPIWIKDTVTTQMDKAEFSTVAGSVVNYGTSKDKKALDINNIRVHTVSGNIAGEFPLNNAVDLETTNGDIAADIVPSDLREQIGYLKTSTVNGNHMINFISKLNPRPLYSTHNSVNGDVEVTYPEDWQGGLKLKTTSGHIKVAGKGTKVEKKDEGPVGRFWKVVKGEGKSKGSVNTISGKIDILIGEEEDKE
ncbi:hypothetical protein TWF694_006795 [Orbilia ellipsospora]|uniref:Adhesin domain-containing protein n=1 Tax=Orbilia ellipsospora TaxID=2528407 RepID=A0AAV9XMW8_9PEZI